MKTLLFVITFCLVTALTFGETSPPTVKWRPGHYIVVNDNMTTTYIIGLLKKPGFAGIKLKLTWGKFEKTKGVYNFTVLDSFLTLAKQYNRFVILEFWDRSFGNEATPYMLPSYLNTEGYISKTTQGWAAKFWTPYVVDREILLFKALAAKHEADPTLIGIRTPETSTGLAVYPTTRDAYLLQLNRLAAGIQGAFPTTPFFQGINFGFKSQEDTYLPRVIEYNESIYAGIGWPDTAPTRCGTSTSMSLIVKYANRLPKQASMELGTLKTCSPTPTVQELSDFAFQTLGAHYIAWIPWATAPSTYDFFRDVVPFVAAHASPCPGNVKCQ